MKNDTNRMLAVIPLSQHMLELICIFHPLGLHKRFQPYQPLAFSFSTYLHWSLPTISVDMAEYINCPVAMNPGSSHGTLSISSITTKIVLHSYNHINFQKIQISIW